MEKELYTSLKFLEFDAIPRTIREQLGETNAAFSENLARYTKFRKIVRNIKILVWSGANVRKSCRSRKMLEKEYLVAKIGFDPAESEPS